jgi:protein Tex
MATAPDSPALDLSRIAQDLQLRKVQVEAAVQLLDEGNTPPFIARYRKERAGGLDEGRLRVIRDRVADLRHLNERKQTILKTIEAQGKLTDELRKAILTAETAKRVEDLFLPFKPKKRTPAADAREKGLGELAQAIWNRDPAVANLQEVLAGMVNPEKALNSPDDALAGAKLILTEMIAEMAEVRAPVRFALWETGRIVSRKAEPKPESKPPEPAPAPTPAPVEQPAVTPPPAAEGQAPAPTEGQPATPPVGETPAAPAAPTPAPPTSPPPKPKKEHKFDEKKAEEYRDYFDFTEGLRAIPPHRILAVNRGEKEHVLQARLDWDTGRVRAAARSHLPLADHPHRDLLDPLVDEALTQFVLPSLEREIRKELTEEALEHAIEIFARNFRSLLLTPPLRNRRVLAVDPGTRAGTKAVALDERGTPLEDVTVHPLPPQNKVADAKTVFAGMIRKHGLQVIAIGNGSMCREMEQIISDLIGELENPADGQPPVPDLAYAIANEAGAADYSDSPVAREEFPTADRMTRGTIAIGRRLQDPLAELVKIDPQHVGVGLYQHDVKPKHLKESIDEVIESCVNEVGVDINHAGASLLRYVSGLNPAAAQEVVQYRTASGPIRTRTQLLQIPNFGDARFAQAAAFLKVRDGDDPLDATWVHPESYALARQVLAEAGFIDADLRDPEKLPRIKAKLAEVNPADAAARLGSTESVVRDVIAALSDPFHDPRDSRTPPVLKRRMLRLEDLTPGMELKGTVVNVVPFGAFVDIGLKDTGLVHISRMANKFIKNPYEVVGVGDVVSVWVVEVDKDRKRASLTMVAPGQERKPEPRRAFQAPPPRPPRQDRPPQPRQDRPQQPRQDRPAPPRPAHPAGPPPTRQPQDRTAKFQKPRLTVTPPADSPAAATGPAGVDAGGPPKRAGKPKALPKLSTDALAGKAPLGSFAELEAFFKTKDEPPAPPAAAPTEPASAPPAPPPEMPPTPPPAEPS